MYGPSVTPLARTVLALCGQSSCWPASVIAPSIRYFIFRLRVSGPGTPVAPLSLIPRTAGPTFGQHAAGHGRVWQAAGSSAPRAEGCPRAWLARPLSAFPGLLVALSPSVREEPLEHGCHRLRIDHVCLTPEDLAFCSRDAPGDRVCGRIEGQDPLRGSRWMRAPRSDQGGLPDLRQAGGGRLAIPQAGRVIGERVGDGLHRRPVGGFP